MNEEYEVILVDSTSLVMRIEKLLKNEGLPYKLIPVPRHLSSDCGICVRIFKQDSEAAKALLTEHQIDVLSYEEL